MPDKKQINEGWQPEKFGYQPNKEERGYQPIKNQNEQKPSNPPKVDSSVKKSSPKE